MNYEEEQNKVTIERCQSIKSYLLTEMAMFVNYEWNDKYKLECINRVVGNIKDSYWYKDIDPRKLTKEQMLELGFNYFTHESTMMLIPLWMYPFLIYYIQAESINGRTVYHKDAIDNDHRYGSLAYGVYPADA